MLQIDHFQSHVQIEARGAGWLSAVTLHCMVCCEEHSCLEANCEEIHNYVRILCTVPHSFLLEESVFDDIVIVLPANELEVRVIHGRVFREGCV